MCHSHVDTKGIGGAAICVSRHVPGLREKFLAPAAELVCLRYEGGFGERMIAEPVLLTAKGKYVTWELAADARQEYRELCVTLLELRFPYWYAGEGAEGRFDWHLASDKLTHTHRLRVVEDFVEGTAPVSAGDLHLNVIPF